MIHGDECLEQGKQALVFAPRTFDRSWDSDTSTVDRTLWVLCITTALVLSAQDYQQTSVASKRNAPLQAPHAQIVLGHLQSSHLHRHCLPA